MAGVAKKTAHSLNLDGTILGLTGGLEPMLVASESYDSTYQKAIKEGETAETAHNLANAEFSRVFKPTAATGALIGMMQRIAFIPILKRTLGLRKSKLPDGTPFDYNKKAKNVINKLDGTIKSLKKMALVSGSALTGTGLEWVEELVQQSIQEDTKGEKNLPQYWKHAIETANRPRNN